MPIFRYTKFLRCLSLLVVLSSGLRCQLHLQNPLHKYAMGSVATVQELSGGEKFLAGTGFESGAAG